MRLLAGLAVLVFCCQCIHKNNAHSLEPSEFDHLPYLAKLEVLRSEVSDVKGDVETNKRWIGRQEPSLKDNFFRRRHREVKATYYLSKKQYAKNIQDAIWQCKNLDTYGRGYLYESTDIFEYGYVRNWLNTLKTQQYIGRVVISGRYDVITNKWWSSYGHTELTQLHWSKGQPEAGYGNCLKMHQEDNWNWFNGHCAQWDEHDHFLCVVPE